MTEPQAWDLVTQTLGRLETKIDAGLAALSAKLDQKASTADLSRLYGRIEGTEHRLGTVERTEGERISAAEAARDHEQQHRDRSHRRVLALCSMLSTAALVLAVVHP